MKVLFNTTNSLNFRSAKASAATNVAQTNQKVETKNASNAEEIKKQQKAKIAARCCLACVIGIDILYFAMKRSFKYDRIAQDERKLVKLSNMVAPARMETLLKGKNTFH